VVYLFSSNLPAPINEGPDPQTKEGNLIIEGNLTTKGILKLGQFTTADLPAGVEGALCFNTTKNITQIYTLGDWRDLTVTRLGLGETCSLDGDCDLGHCVDGVCCNTSCEGTCNRCNVAGSIGTCIEAPSDCTGCSICSSGNCIADPTKCSGNCVQCTGSGANYSCSANDTLCTGDCSFCTGSGTEYSCAGSNGFCSNTTSSCSCSGSGTIFNCQSCPDTYGVCGHPTCSSNSCGNAYDNGVACATCKTCSSGSCSVNVPAGSTGLNCTATHYRCDGNGNCTAPLTLTCVGNSYCTGNTCAAQCVQGYDVCSKGNANYDCSGTQYNCNNVMACGCTCGRYVY